MAKVNPYFIDEIRKLGAFDITACYNCGTCTAICPLSEKGHEFPRKMIRYSILGLEDEILKSADPWLCYYCGECTQTCPRNADPGGLMMALRRFLTTKYDWTGFSRRLYLSKTVELIGIFLLALISTLLVYFLHGPVVKDHVELATFAPVHIVEIGDLIILFGLSALLLINIYRMFRFIALEDGRYKLKVPIKAYFTEFFKYVIPHFFTQMKFRFCENKRYWITHLFIVYGYAMAFILVVLLLRLFQTNEMYPFFHPIRVAGYISTGALLYGIIVAAIGRIKRKQPVWQYSHSTDWMFLILLFITVLTGFLVDVFKYANLPMATYITYTIHLAVVTPLLVLEVPFAKWSHLAYRPFAIYFARLKELSRTLEEKQTKEALKTS